MSDTNRPCSFAPPHEPWSCTVHPGGYRTSLLEDRCRAALAAIVEPMTMADVEEFDRWAEGRRGKGASLGMLWALRLRITLAAEPFSVPHREDDEPCACDECMSYGADDEGFDWYRIPAANRIVMRILDGGDSRLAPLVEAFRDHEYAALAPEDRR